MFRFVASFACILAAALAASSPAFAEPIPELEKIMTPKEKQLFANTVREQLGKMGTDTAPRTMSVLDALLAQDLEPTQFRGYLQLLRSQILLGASRTAEATTAVDESVRLLPGYSAPLLQAFEVYAYTGRPAEGADFLLRAAELDPESVKAIGDYDIKNLTYLLEAARDTRRLEAVAAKLLQIGWIGKQVDSRSKLALYAIQRRISDGDVAGARALVPELVVPEDTYALLADNRFKELWPALETWAGPKLERQWPIYLEEARARYAASKDVAHVIAYISSLDSAGFDTAVIAEALPLFVGEIDPQDDDLIFVTLRLAEPLSRAGRWQELQSVFGRAEQVWPLDSQPTALNLFANQARYLLYQDRPSEAVQLMDRAIEKAKAWGAMVNPDAVASMYLYRVCALHRMGRDADLGSSILFATKVKSVDSLVTLDLCLGDEAGARNVLIAALGKEEARTSAIAVLQLPSHPPCKSSYCSDMERLRTALRTDPAVLEELQKVGRILPFKVNESARLGTKSPSDNKPNGSITTSTAERHTATGKYIARPRSSPCRPLDEPHFANRRSNLKSISHLPQ